jgi:hypothetical protein
MKTLMILFVALALNGCAAFFIDGSGQMRSQNKQRLTTLKLGSTRDEVMRLMGTESATSCHHITCVASETLPNPYRVSMLQADGKTYEILYYYTDVKQMDGAITDDELTPLVLEDGKLIGWGQELVSSKVNKHEIRIR